MIADAGAAPRRREIPAAAVMTSDDLTQRDPSMAPASSLSFCVITQCNRKQRRSAERAMNTSR
ncbi:hypothetical protein GCM10023200_42360 [Actinomycetospora chlora]|uniref:Uncharacterized protein n=1 Tax=Actinomycetospora chlora TaxID=663608 RepID=A0ABP9BYN1_9PSEU